jgi:putative intracellular protease/amidase
MEKSKRILMVVTSHSELGNTGRATGYYLPEVSHPLEIFKKAGFEVDFASPKGLKAPMDPRVDSSDPANTALLNDKEMMSKLNNTIRADQADPGLYEAVFFVGGLGTMWDFRENQALQALTRVMYESGKIISAVCHGPAALVDVKLSNGTYLVKDKRVSGFSNAEEMENGTSLAVPFSLESALIERGGVYGKADLWEDYIQVDGNLITGQNPASAKAVAREVVRVQSARLV